MAGECPPFGADRLGETPTPQEKLPPSQLDLQPRRSSMELAFPFIYSKLGKRCRRVGSHGALVRALLPLREVKVRRGCYNR